MAVSRGPRLSKLDKAVTWWSRQDWVSVSTVPAQQIFLIQRKDAQKAVACKGERARRFQPCIEPGILGKRSGLRGLSLLLSQIAKMPGPDKTLGENDEGTRHDGQSNDRSAMAKMIPSTKKQNEYDVPEPAQGDERLHHGSPQF